MTTIWTGVAAPSGLPGAVVFVGITNQFQVSENTFFWDDSNERLQLTQYGFPPPAPGFGLDFRFARGIAGTPLNVQSGDSLGNAIFNAYTGTVSPLFQEMGGMYALALGNVVNNPGSALHFKTRADGGTAVATRFSIMPDGSILAGAAVSLGYKFEVGGTSFFQNNLLVGATADPATSNGLELRSGIGSGPTYPVIRATGFSAIIPVTVTSKSSGNIVFASQDSGTINTIISDTPSGVNYPLLFGSATGASPANNARYSAAGNDANVGITFAQKGTAILGLTGQTVGTTIGAAGGASALPATPLGYITVSLNALGNVKIPYYNP